MATLTHIGNLIIRRSSSLDAIFEAEQSSYHVEHPSMVLGA